MGTRAQRGLAWTVRPFTGISHNTGIGNSTFAWLGMGLGRLEEWPSADAILGRPSPREAQGSVSGSVLHPVNRQMDG